MTIENQLALIVAICAILGSLGQMGAMFYWAGKLTTRTNEHERRISEIEYKVWR